MPAAPFHAKLLRHSRGLGLVEVAGEVDMNTAQELGDVLAAALQCKPNRLVVDLSAVGFIDSIGLRCWSRTPSSLFAQRHLVRDRRREEAHAGLRDHRPPRRPHLPSDARRRPPLTVPADQPQRVTPSRLIFRSLRTPLICCARASACATTSTNTAPVEEAVGQVVLAVDEACTNALRHSGTTQDLEIHLGFTADDLVVQVRDHGCGFDATRFDPGHVPDPLANDGRGMYLMSNLMDDVQFSSEGGLLVRMVKRAVRRPDSPVVTAEAGQNDVGADLEYWRSRRRSGDRGDGRGVRRARLGVPVRSTATRRLSTCTAWTWSTRTGRSIWEVFPAAGSLTIGPGVRRGMQLGISSIVEFLSPASTAGWSAASTRRAAG